MLEKCQGIERANISLTSTNELSPGTALLIGRVCVHVQSYGHGIIRQYNTAAGSITFLVPYETRLQQQNIYRCTRFLMQLYTYIEISRVYEQI